MDPRYIHKPEYVAGSLFTPGWIDADSYPWAKALNRPGECGDLFCACHDMPLAIRTLQPSSGNLVD